MMYSLLLPSSNVFTIFYVRFLGQPGTVILDELTGGTPPAGRLPAVHCPAPYVNDVFKKH